MTTRAGGRVAAAVVGAAGAAAAGTIGFLRARRPRPEVPALRRVPTLVAHRGGAGLAPENTMVAFRSAVRDWGADMIELDVHASADDRCVVIHDPTVDRTTDGTGSVAALSSDELRRLDAGYRFTRDGRSYPFRGRGVRIPTIDEVFAALPETSFIVEVKARAALPPLFDAIRHAGAEQRVLVAPAAGSEWSVADAYAGAICASARALRRFYLLHRLRLAWTWAPDAGLASVPEIWGGRRIVTPRFIRDLHRVGLRVHIWTVNHPDDMERLLDWKVDGLITDRPDLLADLLTRRFGRAPAPAHTATPAPSVE